MSGKFKILAVAAAAVLLVLVLGLIKLIDSHLTIDPPPEETVATVPRFTVSPDATLAPGFGEDEFPIVPVG